MSTTPQQRPSVPHNSLWRERGPIERVTDSLETPSLDDRSYRVIRLPNQLEVLLVHDADTDKASAAMDVNVGNFSDEENMPGMAHAVEHLLFMGTKKYPAENAYSQYLSAHSGSSNAYTGATSTNYYFEIAAENPDEPSGADRSPLYGALDRFAQFFIDPLFLSSTLDRELQAVDSENKKNLQSDQWRSLQLDKSLSNPKHPYSHFSTGNLEVLKIIPESQGIDVRQKFMDFHEKHYSANRMKLVILGKESLDILEEWAVDLFAGIRNKNLAQNRWEEEKPFREEDLLTQCFVKPVMDSRQLDISFPFIDEEFLYESQPSRYLSHLIGHEGPGSIMLCLKSKGWTNGLSAGAYQICPGTPGIFNCQIRLTENGLKNFKEIIKIFFQYISLLRETDIQRWIFEEQQGLADLGFKFRQKTPASRFTSKTSSVMQSPLPREWLLSGHSKLRKFDPEKIRESIACLRPDNFRIMISSQGFPGNWDRKEKWYGTEFRYEKMPESLLAEIRQAANSTPHERDPTLHLPNKNQFIPTNLEVDKKSIREISLSPRLIRNDDLVRTWYKKDDQFWVPKANLFINFRNPLTFATAENYLRAGLYTDVVQDALEEYSYDAELAGLDYSVTSHSSGIEVTVSGYNDKLSVLLEKVLTTMRDLEVKQDRFEIIKEQLRRRFKNLDFGQPYNQVGVYTRWLSSEKGYINDQVLAEFSHLTHNDIQQYFPQILRQMHIETFVHGNLYKEDALKITDLIENTLKPRALPKSQWPISRSLVFPPGGYFLYHKTLKDPANINNCIEYLLYVGDKSIRPLRAKVLLLDQMTNEPAFDQLRTKEQLGYVVFSGARTAATTIGYRFIIQSEKTPKYLESRIESFLNSYANTLEKMTESEFENHKRSLILKCLEKLKNLDQESGRIWSQIDSEFLDFELAQKDATEIKLITKSEMTQFYNHFIHPASPLRSKLAIYLEAQSCQPDSNFITTTTKPETDTQTNPNQEQVSRVSDDGVKNATHENKKTEPYLITDVREFKSKLLLSAGPQPVKHLSEFEGMDPKL